MNIQLIFSFLKKLAANNDRAWFNAHKAEYQAAKDEYEKLVNLLILRISEFDPSIRNRQASDFTYRIYRDLRFTQDKTPYKTHFGAYINARGKKEFHHCGYYIHLEPSGSMLAGGCYEPEGKMLKALRQSVVDNIDEYRSIMEKPSFRRYFPTVGDRFLKTLPQGFPKDFPYPDYIRCKDYAVLMRLEDSFFKQPDFVDTLADACREMKPFFDFVNYVTDDYA